MPHYAESLAVEDRRDDRIPQQEMPDDDEVLSDEQEGADGISPYLMPDDDQILSNENMVMIIFHKTFFKSMM